MIVIWDLVFLFSVIVVVGEVSDFILIFLGRNIKVIDYKFC